MGNQHGIFMAKKNESYGELVIKAVLNIKDYIKGASRPAIKKYIESNHKKVLNQSSLRTALTNAVKSGDLIQEGQRFKLNKEKRAQLRKPTPKPKKKVVKKTKKTKKKSKAKGKKSTKKTAKKSTTKKKKTAKKKSTKKKTAKKSP